MEALFRKMEKDIEDSYDEVRDIFRKIHRNPELGQEEYQTQALIIENLKTWKIPYKVIAETGVIGIIEGTKPRVCPKKVVALRADIDALPIQEDTSLAYASKNLGIMHACGHDAHTAILLGVGKVLSKNKEDLSGSVKLLFQPAEETIGGAKRMVEEGCMENPRVDYVLGLHVFPRLETGTVELTYGTMNASTDVVEIVVEGKSGHGAYPHDSLDAIVASAHVITALQTIVSRTISPIESVVLSLGLIEGGVKHNVIADRVVIKGSLRTLDEKQRRLVKERAKEIVEHTCKALGTQGRINFHEGYNALVNDNHVVSQLEESFKEVLGNENILIARNPSLGAEDFSFFLDKAKGAFYNLGCGNEKLGIIYKGHHPKFVVDEPSLGVGMRLQIKATLDFLELL